MVCKSGRPKLPTDQDRILFSESAGTCLICNTHLFPNGPNRERAILLAERAHIVAYSDDGPRADPSLAPACRSNHRNIVLLCPTCHTKVDKAPDSYPAEDLLRRKETRRQAVDLVGGTPIFSTRPEARRAAERLLARNRSLFEQYGPHPDDGSTKSAEGAHAWTARVLDEIVPNNRLLVALVEMNEDLTTKPDRDAAELLRQHTDDLERKHIEGQTSGPAKRFPVEAEVLFGSGGG